MFKCTLSETKFVVNVHVYNFFTKLSGQLSFSFCAMEVKILFYPYIALIPFISVPKSGFGLKLSLFFSQFVKCEITKKLRTS